LPIIGLIFIGQAVLLRLIYRRGRDAAFNHVRAHFNRIGETNGRMVKSVVDYLQSREKWIRTHLMDNEGVARRNGRGRVWTDVAIALCALTLVLYGMTWLYLR